MLPVLSIGPLSVPVPGLVLLFSIWVGLTLSEKYAPRYQVAADDLSNLMFTALAAGVIGARVSFLASVPSIFLADPLSLFALDLNMLDLPGGLVIGAAGGFFYGSRKGLPLYNTLDALAIFLAVVSIGIGFSNLASGAAYGSLTDLPWGIKLWGAVRHPTQVYAIIGRGLILAAIWPGQHDQDKLPGMTFFTFAALTAGWQLFITGFRGDSELILSGLRSAQIISWLILAAACWGIHSVYQRHRRIDGS